MYPRQLCRQWKQAELRLSGEREHTKAVWRVWVWGGFGRDSSVLRKPLCTRSADLWKPTDLLRD